MAIRGVLTTLTFYPANYDSGTSPLYTYQNYFPGTRTIGSTVYTYNSFQISSITYGKDAVIAPVTVTFAATAANVDLVEAAIANKYIVAVIPYRWSAVAGLEDPAPSDFSLLSAYIGDASGGSADLTTVTLELAFYSDSLNTDLPWRKMPWTILGPLSFRR